MLCRLQLSEGETDQGAGGSLLRTAAGRIFEKRSFHVCLPMGREDMKCSVSNRGQRTGRIALLLTTVSISATVYLEERLSRFAIVPSLACV